MTTNTFVDRKAALSQWGASLRWLLKSEEWNGYEMGIEESIYNEFKSVVELANVKNPWFTEKMIHHSLSCLLYTSPSPRDAESSRMPSSA